jgi:mannose-6-phosphate isomerase-like protein (cupin superfamily)
MSQKPHIQIAEAASSLAATGQRFVELFRHGSLAVEYYKPEGVDLQQPHDRDEIYVIASGTGIFVHEDAQRPFQAGDFIFVKAGDEHRFVDFTEDFATWVFFYGPVGGEERSSEA